MLHKEFKTMVKERGILPKLMHITIWTTVLSR